MQYPASTGQVATHLGVPEPRLNDLIRRQKIEPTPPVIAGRRHWQHIHVTLACEALGLPAPKPPRSTRDSDEPVCGCTGA